MRPPIVPPQRLVAWTDELGRCQQQGQRHFGRQGRVVMQIVHGQVGEILQYLTGIIWQAR